MKKNVVFTPSTAVNSGFRRTAGVASREPFADHFSAALANPDEPAYILEMSPAEGNIEGAILTDLSASLFLGGGGGFYLSSYEFEADTGKVSSSDDDLGAYGNAGAIFHAGSTDIEGSLKLHWVSFEDIWLSLTVGVYF